jgi:hypothetical protein
LEQQHLLPPLVLQQVVSELHQPLLHLDHLRRRHHSEHQLLLLLEDYSALLHQLLLGDYLEHQLLLLLGDYSVLLHQHQLLEVYLEHRPLHLLVVFLVHQLHLHLGEEEDLDLQLLLKEVEQN